VSHAVIRNPPTRICVITVFGVLLGLVNVAAAEDDARIAQERLAKKACAMGDYEKGADILTDLFVTTNDLGYVYNQARCYEQNGLWERAIVRFREYLRKATHLTARERAETEKHITECQGALNTAAPAAAPQQSEALPTVVASAAMASDKTPAPATPVASAAGVATPPPAVASQGRGLRVAGVVLATVGVAAIGTGAAFALKTQSISTSEQKNGPTQAQEDQRKTYETWGWVSYGVGAAALATGVVLYIVGWPRDESSKVALLPSLNPTGASLLIGGRF
jgi:hypothetical protein